jgi:predicted transcriptional regulator
LIIYDEAHDWWRRISADEKDAILEGLNQLKRGEGITHEEMVKKYKQWL